jgi:hypothetical protein
MRDLGFPRTVWSLEKVLALRNSGADGRTIMILSRPCWLARIAVVALALTVAFPMGAAQSWGWRGGGGWHGGGGWGWGGGGCCWRGGGWGWRGGGWGWGFGLTLPPLYYAPPPYYYPPPVYYPPPAYYSYPSYGYAPGSYGSGGTTYAQPGYGGLLRPDPTNCGTPDQWKPCPR